MRTAQQTQHNVGLMLVHCLRRWPNIKPTLFQCVVFARDIHSYGTAITMREIIYIEGEGLMR